MRSGAYSRGTWWTRFDGVEKIKLFPSIVSTSGNYLIKLDSISLGIQIDILNSQDMNALENLGKYKAITRYQLTENICFFLVMSPKYYYKN